jgi:CRP/FNR family transcriptional regulator
MEKHKFSHLADDVAEIPLFSGLPRENIEELASIVVDKNTPRNHLIFSEGDLADGFYVVIGGRVKIFKLSLDGKEQIIHIFGPGEPFGEVPVFQGKHFPAHAESLSDCRLFFFPRTAFVSLIKNNPSLALNMLAELSRRLRAMTVMIEDLSLKEAPGRLAAYLLYLSRRSGGSDELMLDIAKVQLASLLGTTPETLSRILGKLVRQGLIESSGPRIQILDRESLEVLASEGKLLE